MRDQRTERGQKRNREQKGKNEEIKQIKKNKNIRNKTIDVDYVQRKFQHMFDQNPQRKKSKAMAQNNFYKL